MLNLIKKMAPLCAMLVVTACDSPISSNLDNSFVKGYDGNGTHMTAFCYTSRQECLTYFEANCKDGMISYVSVGSGPHALITVSGWCQEK